MANHKPNILLIFNRQVRESYIPHLINWDASKRLPIGIGLIVKVGKFINLTKIQRLLRPVEEIDGMVGCHGAPRVDAGVLDHAPRLKYQYLS